MIAGIAMQNSFVLPCSYCWNLLLLLEGVLPGSILTAVGAITRGSDCDHNGRVENQSRSWHADFLFSLSLSYHAARFPWHALRCTRARHRCSVRNPPSLLCQRCSRSVPPLYPPSPPRSIGINCPTRTLVNSNCPCASAVKVVSTPVAVLMSSTLAPGITAPEASWTKPRTDAVSY